MNTFPDRKNFAAILKQTRLQKHWRQEDLAAALHVNPRTCKSWEAGKRIPSVGMVFLLCLVLTNGKDSAVNDVLSQGLFTSYLIDDLERQANTYDDPNFGELAVQTAQLLDQFSAALQKREQKKEKNERLGDIDLFGSGGHTVIEVKSSRRRPPQVNQEAGSPGTGMEALFTVFDRLRDRPDLIGPVIDFLQEVAAI